MQERVNALFPMAIAALALTTLVSCKAPPEVEEPQSEVSTGPLLTFTVDGAGFDERTFAPDLTTMTNHWVYDPRTKQTRIHISGQEGD